MVARGKRAAEVNTMLNVRGRYLKLVWVSHGLSACAECSDKSDLMHPAIAAYLVNSRGVPAHPAVNLARTSRVSVIWQRARCVKKIFFRTLSQYSLNGVLIEESKMNKIARANRPSRLR